MKYNPITILLLLCVLLFNRCSKPSCLESSGPITSTMRDVSPFHQIDLYNNLNLVLTQDTLEVIRVEAGEHLQPNISTTIENGVLILKNTTDCNWLRSPSERITVYVSVKKLDGVNYRGSGNITSTNTIIADYIKFYSDKGAGNVNISLQAKRTDAAIEYENADFKFRGKSDICYAYVNARGSIDFEDFEVKTMYIGYASVRNTVIHVTGLLDATIYHKGSLYYKGSPVTTASYFSSGRLYTAP